MSGLNISFQWRTACATERSDPYYFPDKFTRYFRQRYAVPAVYRWRAMKRQPGERETVYIGEAEELTRRIQRVLTPSATAKDSNTNKRLHQIFRKRIAEGQKIVLDVADIEPFEINGVRFDQQSIGDRFKRRTLENLILVFTQASNEFELLNVFIDPLDKARETLLRKMTPSQIRETLKRYRLDSSAGLGS